MSWFILGDFGRYVVGAGLIPAGQPGGFESLRQFALVLAYGGCVKDAL